MGPDLERITTEAIAALAREADIYQRSGELVEHRPAEVARRAKVDGQVEVTPRAGEVLVELTPGLVRRLRRTQDARDRSLFR